jgi:RNA polymerase sigma-70 factor (ECF subfamily)
VLDEDLLHAIARSRDKAAFAQLFARYVGKVRGFLARHLRSEAEAEEVVQDVMLTLWRRAETFDCQKSAASTWIFRVARNKMIDRLRVRSRLEPSSDDPLFEPESSDVPNDRRIEASQHAQLLRQAINELPRDQLDVVVQVYFERRTLPELAVESGIALGTLKSRLRLGMEKLRCQLQAQREEFS